MKSFVSAPVIGPWLYRRSVKELKNQAHLGDVVAVRKLAGIFCRSTDKAVREIARTAISTLVDQTAIDTFCREALAKGEAALLAIAIDRDYLPSDPGMQAIFLFVTGQRERFAKLDYQTHRPLLSAGYAQVTNQGRIHALCAAQKTGQCSVLAAALMEPGYPVNDVAGSEEEWEIVIAGLIEEHKWKKLWRMVIHAPLNPAITALSAMNAAGWKPAGEEQDVWEQIMCTLPTGWNSPVPEDTTPYTSRCPDSQPLRLVFSSDGALLAAGCADGTMYLWNTRAGTLLYQLPAGQATPSGLAFSPDNACLLCIGTNGTLQGRDTLTGALLWSVMSGGCTPVQFVYSHKGMVIVPLRTGGHLRIVNMKDGQVKDLTGGHKAAVSCCCLSCDDRLCAIGHADGTVGIWDLKKTHFLRTLDGLGDPVRSLSFCEDNNEILVIYDQNRPSRWNIISGVRTLTYSGSTHPLRYCAITPNGSAFAISGDDRILRFWQKGKNSPIAGIPLYNRPLAACSVSPDGQRFATGCTDGTLRIYAMNEGKLIHESRAHKRAITAIALSSAADMVASTCGAGFVKLWNATSGELVLTLLRPAGGVTGIAAPPDVSSIYAGYSDGTVRQIQYATGQFIKTLDMYTKTIRAIAISADGTLIACAGEDTLRIWNAGTGGLVMGIEGLTTSQRSLLFSPDGKTLFSGGWDGTVRLWNIPDGSLIKILEGHTSTITALAITRDGALLATGSNDRSVRLWNPDADEDIFIRENIHSEVSALALSPDDTILVFAGADAVIHFCHLPDGEPAVPLSSLPGKITALAFAGNGRTLVAGYDTGTVAVYSCAGRRLLRTVPAHAAAVTGIVVLPGGDSMLTCGLDGQVRFWNLPWTRPLSETTLDDISLVEHYKRTCSLPETKTQWDFLQRMLAARFSHDIELRPITDDAGLYDIQIVG